MKFYDVSLPIKENMIIYPNNPKPSIKRYSSIPQKRVNESLIMLGSHTGTHVDSKLHIQNNVEGAEELPLESFYGKCKVLNLTHVESMIHKVDLEKYQIDKGDIILLKTRNSTGCYDEFTPNYVYVDFDAAEYIVHLGVKTLGFDYISVKRMGGGDDTHAILIQNLTLFEGLDLSKVPEGEYCFIGLPLRINCDGAPARILLIKEK